MKISLDVWLTIENKVKKTGTGIFVRVDGGNKELSVEETKERYPDIVVEEYETETNEVFSYNVTHNLNKMAMECVVDDDGETLYRYLWRPEELGVDVAKDLIEPLTIGLNELIKYESYYKKFKPENGWGNYDSLVDFVSKYLDACGKYPQAKINTWR